MPDTKVSALTDGTTANSTDRIPVARDAGGGTFNNRYVTPGYIGTTLLGSGTALTGSTVTTSSPVLNLTQTWNAAGVTFTGLKFNATDTASASGSMLADLQVGGASKFQIFKNGAATAGGAVTVLNTGGDSVLQMAHSASYGYHMASGYVVTWGSSATLDGSIDLTLRRAAAATLQLGAADAAAPVAQTFKVQSGTAGASALSCSISGTTLTVGGAVTGTIAIGHAVTGTNVSAGTVITAGSGVSWTVNNSQTVSSTTMYFNSVGANFTIRGSQGSGPSAGGSLIFQVAPAGSAATTAQNAYSTALTIATTAITAQNHLLFSADNTYDIGASGANRPRNLYVANFIAANGGATFSQVGVTATGAYYFENSTIIETASDGVLKIINWNRNDFNRLQFGGTTSSFPALKRSSASLICRLADDSANAAFEALSLKTSAPAGGTSGTWKVGVYNATAPSATGYVEVDIGGTLYKLLAST